MGKLFRTLFILAFTAAAAYMGYMCVNTVSNALQYEQELLQCIGKSIVIDGDTLLITNYKPGGYGQERGFVLSNGATVGFDVEGNGKDGFHHKLTFEMIDGHDE